jgi:hypothetical protein
MPDAADVMFFSHVAKKKGNRGAVMYDVKYYLHSHMPKYGRGCDEVIRGGMIIWYCQLHSWKMSGWGGE